MNRRIEMERDWLDEIIMFHESHHGHPSMIYNSQFEELAKSIKQAIAENAPPEEEVTESSPTLADGLINNFKKGKNSYRAELFKKLNLEEGLDFGSGIAT